MARPDDPPADATASLFDEPGETAPTKPSAPSAPGANDRYQLEALLGKGGMGEVHRAFDRTLQRPVALKLLPDTTPEHARRLLHEAQAQARIDHPNVCKLFSVGMLAERPFLAMQLVEGGTLRQVAPRMSLEQRVRVLAEVADGLHAAHRAGLIHRDVKPSNILVEETDDDWHPYVTDFGLARGEDAHLTQTNAVIGTPHYMAPEQAEPGRTINRRTDVFALGATLWEVLTGTPPFDSDSTAAVLYKVVHEEPAPMPREAAVPADLEAIARKCLEKDPRHRYATRDFADDLRRFLDGDPVAARRSLGYRWGKRVRKHRLLASLIAISVVLAGAIVGTVVRARLNAQKQARLAHRFGELAQGLAAQLRYDEMLPLHDTRPLRRAVHAEMERLRVEIASSGAAAIGPGRYALGRLALALHDPASARVELETARSAGYDPPELDEALGEALAELYHDGMKRLEVLPVPDKAARRKQLEQALRDPALRLLAATGGDRPEALLLRARVAWLQGKLDESQRLARAAWQAAPWLFEARQVEGMVRYAAVPAGDAATLRRAADERTATLADALNIGRSAAALYADACDALRAGLDIEINDHVELLSARVAVAKRTCENALVADPDHVDGARRLGALESTQARAEILHGRDPRPHAHEALRLFQRATDLAPDDERAAVLALFPSTLGASWALDHGGDPRPLVERTLADCARLLRADPELTGPLDNAILAHIWQGLYESRHGVDPRPSYQAALAAIERRLAGGGDPAENVNLRAWMFYEIARHQARIGEDPRPTFARAIEAGDFAVAHGDAWELQVTAGQARFLDAAYRFAHDEDPTPLLAKATPLLARGAERDKSDPESRRTLGEAELLLARWDAAHGRDPEPRFAAARTWNDRAVAVSPNDVENARALGDWARRVAEHRLAHHHDAAPAIADGLRAVASGLAVDGERAALLVQKGALHLLEHRARPSQPGTLEAACAAFNRAFAVDPLLKREWPEARCP